MTHSRAGQKLSKEGIENDRDVDEKGGGDQDEKRDDGGVRVGAAAAENPELYLDDVRKSQHQEDGAEDGAEGGDEDG